ncbi:hypothetical protein [Streptomyces sp. NPDC002564]|uniref:hypothetical protein n=1 Tax=Streptomyces sp. NPDC002564 TaxID=3364649 RepID=UPI00367F36B4
MHGKDAEGGAPDALMLAITGEPVPDGTPRDPAFDAEHAAAVADLALLRERLGTVGDALAAGPRRAAPAVAPRPPRARARRGLLVVAGGAVAALAASALLGGLAWLAVEGGAETGGGGDGSKGAASDGQRRETGEGSADAGGDSADLSPEGFVACSRLIVEGTVTAVDAVPGGLQDRVTLDVTRYLKPRSGEGTVRFPMDRDVDPRLKTGDRVLITVTEGSAEPANWAVGKERDRLRTTILKALPAAEKIRCDRGPGPAG